MGRRRMTRRNTPLMPLRSLNLSAMLMAGMITLMTAASEDLTLTTTTHLSSANAPLVSMRYYLGAKGSQLTCP